MDTEQQLQNLRDKYKTANPRERLILMAKAKDLKKIRKFHKCTAGVRSYREGMTFVFICSCGEELGRDYLQTKHVGS